jgi:hypothetical protein
MMTTDREIAGRSYQSGNPLTPGNAMSGGPCFSSSSTTQAGWFYRYRNFARRNDSPATGVPELDFQYWQER